MWLAALQQVVKSKENFQLTSSYSLCSYNVPTDTDVT